MNNKAPEHIQAALSILEDMDDETRKAYKSNLPRHATKLHKAGTTVTKALLLDHIEQGLIEAHNASQKKSYDSIVQSFKAKKTKTQQPDELPGNNNVIVGFGDFDAQLTEDQRQTRETNKQIIKRFEQLAKEGNLKACTQMIAEFGTRKMDGWGDNPISFEKLIKPAMSNGHLEMLKAAIKHLDEDEYWQITSEYSGALKNGHMHIMRYVCEDLNLGERVEEKYSQSPYSMHIKDAIKAGHWDAVAYTLPNILPQMKQGEHKELAKELFENALRQKNTDDIKEIISWGLSAKDYYDYDKELYFLVTMEARFEKLEFLVQETDFFDADDIAHIFKFADPFDDKKTIQTLSTSDQSPEKPALGFKGWMKLFGLFLREHLYAKSHRNDAKTLEMAEELGLPKLLRGPVANRIDRNIQEWERMNLTPSGHRMSALTPDRVGYKAFTFALDIFKKEGLMDDIAHEYAYQTAALFRSPDRILQYLEKWGADTNQPLHDIAYMVKVPQKGDFDAKSWGDAVLQHGPKMARLVAFADRIPQPLKSVDGQTFSYVNTKAETAKFIYKKAKIHPEFAALCHEQSYKEADFNRGIKLIQQFQRTYAANDNKKTGDHIPDITIDGAEFGMNGYTFRKLDDGNPKGMLLGVFTDCCQHLGNAGKECAEHGFMSPHGGFYVIEDEEGKIIGQSWAWRGKEGELVLDSLEHLKGRMNGPKWEAIVTKIANHVEAARPDITAVNIGIGGKTPTMSFQRAAQNAEPKDYDGYRDSQVQYSAYRKPPRR